MGVGPSSKVSATYPEHTWGADASDAAARPPRSAPTTGRAIITSVAPVSKGTRAFLDISLLVC